jgi:FkbM family methyltransferase
MARDSDSPRRLIARAAGRLRPLRRRLRQWKRERNPVFQRDTRDNEHMRLLFAFLLAPDSNCIDVGALSGTILAEMVRIAPRGKHIAYEPLPHMHEKLVARFPDVDVRRAALSNTTGRTTFRHVKSNAGYSGLKERDYPGPQDIEIIQVDTEELDKSLPTGYVPALIKIDVEGAELQVLEGAKRTITQHKPTVIFEHGASAAAYYGTPPSAIFKLLSDAGLRIFDIDGNGPYRLEDFEHPTSRGGPIWNFVAHV